MLTVCVRVRVCTVRYTKEGSWQGYRGNTVCVWCARMSYYPFLLFTQGTTSWQIMAPQLGTVVNGFTLDLDADEGGKKTLPRPNSSIIYVQTVCSSSNYHSASSSQGAL